MSNYCALSLLEYTVYKKLDEDAKDALAYAAIKPKHSLGFRQVSS